MGVSKEVIQYDLNGIEVRIFKSTIESVNFNSNYINDVDKVMTLLNENIKIS